MCLNKHKHSTRSAENAESKTLGSAQVSNTETQAGTTIVICHVITVLTVSPAIKDVECIGCNFWYARLVCVYWCQPISSSKAKTSHKTRNYAVDCHAGFCNFVIFVNTHVLHIYFWFCVHCCCDVEMDHGAVMRPCCRHVQAVRGGGRGGGGWGNDAGLVR